MFRNITVATVCAVLLAGCTTDPYTGENKISNTAVGAGAGALLGTAAGLIVGQNSSASTRKAMLIGAGLGALAGGGVGLYMDNQEAKLRERLRGTGVSVTRSGDDIILNMPSNITFDTDQSEIKSEFFETLNSVSLVLKEFNQTLVDVTGHTDSTGSVAHNQQLSERRAGSVAEYLIAQGNDPNRFQAIGVGASQPIASNATPDGRALNRRVEIRIVPLT
ncbi:OmpA family protein [Aestuariivirga sp.]|jgi:outer membrane protein OmpA-like peptidoglycan-associated protein|uniref:OmpA family protein n=1 Tax=Aestuariivirga sp. TaxID=2650926 RepID=UPI003782FA23